MEDDYSRWPPPSESRRVRICLYLSEGLLLGGCVAAIFLFPVLRVIHFFIAGFPRVSTTTVVIIILLIIAFIHSRLPLLIVGLPSTPDLDPDRYPMQHDWSETRQWKWVLAIASLTVLVVLGTSLAVWGWERTATTRDTVVPALILASCGWVLLVYSGYQLGEYIK